MYPQVMTMLLMDQVQRLINQFKIVETFNKYSSDQADKMKPHPFLDTVLLNEWEPRINIYLYIAARTTVIPLFF